MSSIPDGRSVTVAPATRGEIVGSGHGNSALLSLAMRAWRRDDRLMGVEVRASRSLARGINTRERRVLR